MPRVRGDPPHPMTQLLHGYEMNGNSLARIIKTSPTTALKKIRNPQYLTVGDLLAINRSVGIPLDDLRRCIS
jgi:hypothetical protein